MDANQEQLLDQERDVGYDINEIAPPAPTRSKSAKAFAVVGALLVVAAVVTVVGDEEGHWFESSSATHLEAIFPPAARSAPRPTFPMHPILSALVSPGVPVEEDPSVLRHQMAVNITSASHNTTLSMDAQAVKDVLALDNFTSIMQVACQNDSLAVLFQTDMHAKEFASIVGPNTLMTVLPQWGCQALRRAIPQTIEVAGRAILIKTVFAELGEFFKHALITYNGTGMGHANHTGIEHPRTTVSQVGPGPPSESGNGQHRDRRWSFHRFIHHVTDDVHHVEGKVKNVIDKVKKLPKAVVDTVKDVVTLVTHDGNLDVANKLYSTSFNIGPKPCMANHAGDHTECSLNANLQINFHLNIHHYHVDAIELYATGDVHGQANTNGQPLTKDWNGAKTDTVFDQTLWSTVIPLGPVPCPISLHGKMQAGYNWDIEAALNIDADASGHGSLKVGAQYAHGKITPIQDNEFTGHVAMNYATGSLTANGGLTLNFIPELKAGFVAGAHAQLTINPTFHAVGTETIEGAAASFSENDGKTHMQEEAPAAPSYPSSCHPIEGPNKHLEDPSLSIVAKAEVDVSAGADIDLKIDHHKIFGKSWDWGTIFDHTWDLGTWCLHLKL